MLDYTRFKCSFLLVPQLCSCYFTQHRCLWAFPVRYRLNSHNSRLSGFVPSPQESFKHPDSGLQLLQLDFYILPYPCRLLDSTGHRIVQLCPTEPIDTSIAFIPSLNQQMRGTGPLHILVAGTYCNPDATCRIESVSSSLGVGKRGVSGCQRECPWIMMSHY